MEKEKQTKMKKSTKYLLIGTLVLFLSIIGASVAYYLARVSGNLSGRAAGTELELTITKLSTSASEDLIPLDNDLETLNLATLGYGNEGNSFDATKACIDINGYSVCQIYRVRVTNKGTVPLTVNGTVELYGANTPNIDCAKMDDEVTITNNASCMGTNILASNVVLPSKNHLDYYVMVFINNLDEPQYDSGEFNGTVVFTTIDGRKVKGRFSRNEVLVDYITNLYTNATKVQVTSNNINYNYATSVNLMNDRLGGTTESLDGGNIRYYGSSPNNYIDIGDKYETDVMKNNWESVNWGWNGAPFNDSEGCLDYFAESLNMSCSDIQVYPNDLFSSAEECTDEAIRNYMNNNINTFLEQTPYDTIDDFCSLSVDIPKGTSILWRIIGVFDGKIRIKRDNPIGPYAYDTSASDINNWCRNK